MSPLDLIKHGIGQGDWGLVCEGYTAMTGQAVEPPEADEYEEFDPTLDYYHDILVRIGTLVRDAVGEPHPKRDEPEGDGFPSPELEEDYNVYLPPDKELLNQKWQYEQENAQVDAERWEQAAKDTVNVMDEVHDDAFPANAGEARTTDGAPRVGRSEEQLDETAKFRVQNNGPAGEKKLAKLLPFVASKGTNKFKDNLKLATDTIQESRDLSVKKGGHETDRGGFQPIELECGKCHKVFTIHPSLRPVRLDSQDIEPTWVCDKCVGKGMRR